ncbi:uncharacterized protein LOC132712228 [Pantherophis guttatus]|uniref:Uncharacterized protein LOC132712228 n=1 Tax=Pantherophis guttatus TaxID=94885 RepID=A0ABM3ZKX0_PANGU|nr:uncharacterized protein LOC132712228 [Pantherophis guttatus]
MPPTHLRACALDLRAPAGPRRSATILVSGLRLHASPGFPGSPLPSLIGWRPTLAPQDWTGPPPTQHTRRGGGYSFPSPACLGEGAAGGNPTGAAASRAVPAAPGESLQAAARFPSAGQPPTCSWAIAAPRPLPGTLQSQRQPRSCPGNQAVPGPQAQGGEGQVALQMGKLCKSWQARGGCTNRSSQAGTSLIVVYSGLLPRSQDEGPVPAEKVVEAPETPSLNCQEGTTCRPGLGRPLLSLNRFLPIPGKDPGRTNTSCPLLLQPAQVMN